MLGKQVQEVTSQSVTRIDPKQVGSGLRQPPSEYLIKSKKKISMTTTGMSGAKQAVQKVDGELDYTMGPS